MGKYTYKKASRWIKINYLYITKKHSLWDYADFCDEYDGTRCLLCFRHGGKLYALNQFMGLCYPIMFDDKDGKLTVIGYYDYTNWYNPYLLEVDSNGEYVRLWNEVINDEENDDQKDMG